MLPYGLQNPGHGQCVTVASKVTGKKGDIIIVDDPHSAKEVASAVKRQAVIDWWSTECFNRVTNAKTGRRLIIGQRTHYEDLPGLAIKKQQFEEFRVPEEFDPEDRARTYVRGELFWEDLRTERGELLRPERFGPEQIEEAKTRTLGPIGYAAQHQQRPLPAEGALFKQDWFCGYQGLGDAFRLLSTGEVIKWEW